MLLSVPREILRTYSSTCVALNARRFSQFASRRSQTPGIFYISPCWLHSKRQVQRSHTRENVAAHADNSSSSLRSVYQNVKETLSRVTEKTEPISSVAELAVRYITVHSLTDFYIECPHGILFDACYVDSHPDGVFCADLKTVVILPGSPGSHLDVLPLMRPLAKAGHRVITVNFPGYSETNPILATQDFLFRGATDEKSDFILNFLKELNIDRVDLMVGLGSGCYPALDLAASQTWIKSLALVCPRGHRVFRGITPYEQFERMARMYDNRMYRLLLILRLVIIKYIQRKWNMRHVPILHLMKYIVEVANYQFENMETNVFAVASRQLPVTYVYSGQDNAMETEISEELARLLNLKPEEFCRLDTNHNLTFPGKKKLSQGLYIEEGTHNPLETQEHCDVIALMLIDELKRTTKTSS
uniref:Uncharacterized protein n=1 Tax=Magallana gigas TaxID=29159 RepID=K1QA66_MAGGI|eukprot:XP_011440352.2 PREDICTED: uncharacterized protein LOC105337361 [Crassostrea gigas]